MAKPQAWGIMVGGGLLGTVHMIVTVKCVCLCALACMHVCGITNLKDLMRHVRGQQQKEDSALAQWCPVSKSEGGGGQGLKPLFLYNEPPTHTTHTFHLTPFVLSTHFT